MPTSGHHPNLITMIGIQVISCDIISMQPSIINLSEESQIEAAIKASLQEFTPQTMNQQTLVFSDDSDTDGISLSPDRPNIPPFSQEPISTVTDVKSVGVTSSLLAQGVSDGSRTKVSINDDGTVAVGRKRLSGSDREGYGEEARKIIRTDIDPVCTAIDNIELTQSMSGDFMGSNSTSVRVVNGKGGRKIGGKGKGKASGGMVPPKLLCASGQEAERCKSANTHSVMIEEQLASGDILKDEVSHILFRLPDGTRLQRSFLCKHPVRVSPVISYNQ